MRTTRQQPPSTAARVLQRIRGKGRGSVFVPADFLDAGWASRVAVDASLGRLVDGGTIRRISRGVYDFPKSSRFGPRSPSPDAVASAVARSTNETVVVSDAAAAHALGVSTQVPAQAVYLTTGTNRTIRVDLGDGKGFDVRFRRVSPSRMLGGNTKAGLVLRALRFLGSDGVDDAVIRKLRAALDDEDLHKLQGLRPKATGWMRSVIDSIVSMNMSTSGIPGSNTSTISGIRAHRVGASSQGAEVPAI